MGADATVAITVPINFVRGQGVVTAVQTGQESRADEVTYDFLIWTINDGLVTELVRRSAIRPKRELDDDDLLIARAAPVGWPMDYSRSPDGHEFYALCRGGEAFATQDCDEGASFLDFVRRTTG